MHSVTGKRWKVSSSQDEDIVSHLARVRRVSLSQEEQLPDPKLLSHIDQACDRILKAVENREQVAIIGDYDCDGITGSLILDRFLRRRGLTPHVRLPDRFTEGYGVKSEMIEEAQEKGVSLILTADTGVTAIEPVAKANTIGVDVIITDHHAPQDVLPEAHSIVHPMLSPDYREPHPCGAGVAFLLVCALEERLGAPYSWDGFAVDLSLAAIGTVADIVPLLGGNRAIVSEGLVALNQLEQHPLADLRTQVSSHGESLTSTDIGFRIAPRINAAGRIAHPDLAYRALAEGGSLLEDLDRLNRERQEMTHEQTNLAIEILEDCYGEQLPSVLCVTSPHIHPGIMGLIAGRLSQKYGRPSLVGSERDGVCRASLRSVSGFDLFAMLSSAKDYFLNFGGHTEAAGCTFDLGVGCEVTEALTAYGDQHLSTEDLSPVLEIDAEIDASALSLDLMASLNSLEPFGKGNSEPLFLLRAVAPSQVRSVGEGGAHLQFRLPQAKAIGFGLGQYVSLATDPVDLVCRIGLSEWNGRREVQLRVEDLRESRPVPEILPSGRLQ